MEFKISQENWEGLKRSLKIKYPQLTKSDLEDNDDSKENVMKMVEYKLRKTKKEMDEIISVLGYSTYISKMYLKKGV
jgi:hypothetical protein